MRAGTTVLSLVAEPLCVPTLRAHLGGPLRLPDLGERMGGVAAAALRGQVGKLRGTGALERHVLRGMPYTVENELTAIGHGVLAVAETVEAWLGRAPEGPIALGSEPAKGAIKALVAGWGSTILHALAACPLSLTELNGVIPDISYPSIERRLSTMRAARQIEALEGEGGSRPYVVTQWARQAVGPIATASRCECLHLEEIVEPPTGIDIEAALLLAVPLVSLPAEHDGSCFLAVDAGGEGAGSRREEIAGVHVEVDGGRVISCASRLERDPATWALGEPGSWLDAIVDGQPSRLPGICLKPLAHGFARRAKPCVRH